MNGSLAPFHALESILIPIDMQSEKIILSSFIINICMYLVLLSVILKIIDGFFDLNNYMLIRTTKFKIYTFQIVYMIKKILLIVLIKLLADILMGNISGWVNFDKLVWYTISTLITLCNYTSFIYSLKLLKIPTNRIFLLVMLIIVVSEFFVNEIRIFTVFVIASSVFIKYPFLFIVIKIIILLFVCILNFKLLKKFENFGVYKYD